MRGAVFPRSSRGKKVNLCTHPPLATLLAYLYLLYNLLFLLICCVSVNAASLGASTRLLFSLFFSLLLLRLLCWLPVISMFFKTAGKKKEKRLWGVFLFCFSQRLGRCAWRRRTLQLLQITDVQFFAAGWTLSKACEQLWAAKKKTKKNADDKTTSLAHLQMVCC